MKKTNFSHWLVILFFIIFVMSLIFLPKIGESYKKLKRFGLDEKIMEKNDTTKGMVVDFSGHENNYKKIENVIEAHGGKIAFDSENYPQLYADIPTKSYDIVAEKLEKMGLIVREELIFKPSLDTSLWTINAPYVLDYYTYSILNGTGRKIGIIDTGIDPRHKDFMRKNIIWRDSIEIVDNNNYSSLIPYDRMGHGTFVASIAAGTGAASLIGDVNEDCVVDISDLSLCSVHNGENWLPCDWDNNGIVDIDDIMTVNENYGKQCSDVRVFKGVAPEADLVIARACKEFATGGMPGEPIIMRVDCKERYVEDAVNWMINQGVDVISMSFGSIANQSLCTASTALNNLIANAISRGIVVVASSSNDGPLLYLQKNAGSSWYFESAVDHPACLNDVISVGATYKTYYRDHEEMDNYTTKYSSKIHVIIEVNGVKAKEYEWEAFNFELEKMFMKSGFDTTIIPSSWPATVRLKFEGMERNIKCHGIFGCSIHYENWWPGNTSYGDLFWEDVKTFNNGQQIVIHFSAWPNIIPWTGQLGWYGYYNYFSKEEESAQGIYHSIFFYYYNTSSYLKDSVPFWSGRGLYTHKGFQPDVVAPGYLVCSANSSQTYGSYENSCSNPNYIEAAGTSASAPHVAGIVALIKQAKPSATFSEIRNAIISTADKLNTNPIKTPGIWDGEGNGKVNVKDAVDYITNCAIKPSLDTDGNNLFSGGTCIDYTFWSGETCASTLYSDYCSGDYIYEYYSSGSSCLTHPPKNCKDYGSTYYCYYGSCRYFSGGGGGGGGGRKK